MQASKKKVLIITYYWPPAGGPGVQRVLKFAKYLPEFGWEPIILTVKDGEYPAIDKSLIQEINPDLKVVKTKTIEFFNLFKFFSQKKNNKQIDTFILNEKNNSLKDKFFKWIRANFFIPDGRIGWKYYAINKGIEIIRKENIDAMFSSSPPHSVQVIANTIKKKTNIPWMADLRDPWINAFWEADLKRTFIANKIGIRQESLLFRTADNISVVSDGMKKDFEKKYSNDNISVITNGFDHSDFEQLTKTQSDRFQIIYTGSISSSQHPTNLFNGLTKLSKLERDKVSLKLYGAVDDSIKKSIDAQELNDIVEIKEYVSHNEVVQIMKNADVLLLLIPRFRADILTGKIFEYLGTSNLILCLGPIGDASQMVTKTTNGIHFNYESDLTQTLKTLISNKNLKTSISTKLEDSPFTRRNITKQLAQKLNAICH